MTPLRPLLLVDACVLIDYANTSRDVLKLVTEHVGKLHVTPTVFREVTQIRPEEIAYWGLTVVEPSLDALGWAGEARGRLSFEDRLAVAVSKEYGFTCVSNDNQLRLECGRQGVPVLWGLELLLALASSRAITKVKARQVGEAMCNANRWLGSEVLERFVTKLEGIKPHRA